ncbi:hypothetical protein T265_03922 [Opisthorchis viverrini]|uniref:Uncharacterized protein n=1 Tax=Opisthorchis viverrini TaxID=6198 RepID=A0A074ZQN7_OPIVI|nr:hypothetical protein T265_03922 [Opisthorchis viverrini]KER29456.1 hypothetical protein T265_03922 [Opisthorchis viverrini]
MKQETQQGKPCACEGLPSRDRKWTVGVVLKRIASLSPALGTTPEQQSDMTEHLCDVRYTTSTHLQIAKIVRGPLGYGRSQESHIRIDRFQRLGQGTPLEDSQMGARMVIILGLGEEGSAVTPRNVRNGRTDEKVQMMTKSVHLSDLRTGVTGRIG